jgi:hypothetical protein
MGFALQALLLLNRREFFCGDFAKPVRLNATETRRRVLILL